MLVREEGKAELVFTPSSGQVSRQTVKDFRGPGIVQGIHNTDDSIRSFARACFAYALDQKVDLWFSTKDTISKVYDARFRDIFQEEYEANWKQKFADSRISYFFTLIDDAVARVVRSEGGMLWALKNYDGDVMSDMVASACGSLAMMTSVLVSPKGGTSTRRPTGRSRNTTTNTSPARTTSTNPMALIFAWSGGLEERGEIDGTPDVVRFADALEAAAVETVESGVMTGDLLAVAEKIRPTGK